MRQLLLIPEPQHTRRRCRVADSERDFEKVFLFTEQAESPAISTAHQFLDSLKQVSPGYFHLFLPRHLLFLLKALLSPGYHYLCRVHQLVLTFIETHVNRLRHLVQPLENMSNERFQFQLASCDQVNGMLEQFVRRRW